MNSTKVQESINQLIAEQQTKQVTRKQYPVAKHQIAKLTELGIIEYMPARYGYTDAAVVIEAAEDSGKAVGGFNAYGEGDVINMPASELYQALHEVETVEDEDEISDERDALDDLMDEVSAIENAAIVKASSEAADRNTDWSS